MTPDHTLLTRLRSGFDAPVYRACLVKHLRRWGLAYLIVALAAWQFQRHFTFALNGSLSLPQQLFLIHKGAIPKRGELVAFIWKAPHPYPWNVKVVKILSGVPGDTVTRIDRAFFVNDAPVGIAKTHSLRGLPLEPGPIGVIPPGHYYVAAPHPDSLDSRYAISGWIEGSQVIGRAYALY